MVFFPPADRRRAPHAETWDRISSLLARRGAVELLLRRLEARA